MFFSCCDISCLNSTKILVWFFATFPKFQIWNLDIEDATIYQKSKQKMTSHFSFRFFAAWQEWQRRWRLCGKWKCKYYSVCGPGNDMYRFSHYIRGTGWQRVSHAGTQTDWAQFSGLWSLFCSLKSLVLHCTLMLQSMLQMLWKNRRQRGTHLRYSKCIFYLYGTIDFSLKKAKKLEIRFIIQIPWRIRTSNLLVNTKIRESLFIYN